MVLNRSETKRKSKDAPPAPDPPKRSTKVHAQRKFAQGSGMNSPVVTPVKEKVGAGGGKPSGDGPSVCQLIPAKRPKTEEFLTYLCFRGTPLLPARLDFFSDAASRKEDPSPTTSPAPPPATITSTIASSVASSSQGQKPKLRVKVKRGGSSLQANKKQLGRRLAHSVQKDNAMRARSGWEERQRSQRATEARLRHRGPPSALRKTPVLKRLGAGPRARGGLRSDGGLSPGGDTGLATDRQARRRKLQPAPTSRPPNRPGRKPGKLRKLQKKEIEDKIKEKEKKEDVEGPVKKRWGLSTRSASNSPAPTTSLSVASRPSRRTKELANLVIQSTVNSDSGSLEEEEEEEIPVSQTAGKKEEDADRRKTQKERPGSSMTKETKKNVNSIKEPITRRQRLQLGKNTGRTEEVGPRRRGAVRGRKPGRQRIAERSIALRRGRSVGRPVLRKTEPAVVSKVVRKRRGRRPLARTRNRRDTESEPEDEEEEDEEEEEEEEEGKKVEVVKKRRGRMVKKNLGREGREVVSEELSTKRVTRQSGNIANEDEDKPARKEEKPTLPLSKRAKTTETARSTPREVKKKASSVKKGRSHSDSEVDKEYDKEEAEDKPVVKKLKRSELFQEEAASRSVPRANLPSKGTKSDEREEGKKGQKLEEIRTEPAMRRANKGGEAKRRNTEERKEEKKDATDTEREDKNTSKVSKLEESKRTESAKKQKVEETSGSVPAKTDLKKMKQYRNVVERENSKSKTKEAEAEVSSNKKEADKESTEDVSKGRKSSVGRPRSGSEVSKSGAAAKEPQKVALIGPRSGSEVSKSGAAAKEPQKVALIGPRSGSEVSKSGAAAKETEKVALIGPRSGSEVSKSGAVSKETQNVALIAPAIGSEISKNGAVAKEPQKVALIGPRKSVGERISSDTILSGSSSVTDCRVVLDSQEVAKEMRRSRKRERKKEEDPKKGESEEENIDSREVAAEEKRNRKKKTGEDAGTTGESDPDWGEDKGGERTSPRERGRRKGGRYGSPSKRAHRKIKPIEKFEATRTLPRRPVRERKVKSMNEHYLVDDDSDEFSEVSSEEFTELLPKQRKRSNPKSTPEEGPSKNDVVKASDGTDKTTDKNTEVNIEEMMNTDETGFQIESSKDKTNIMEMRRGPLSEESPRAAVEKGSLARLVVEGGGSSQAATVEQAAASVELEQAAAPGASNEQREEPEAVHSEAKISTESSREACSLEKAKERGEENRPKPSISETWRQAFMNAKIPKPGQSSPIQHSVKPFVRQKMGGGSGEPSSPEKGKGSAGSLSPFKTLLEKQRSSSPAGSLSPFKTLLEKQRSSSPDLKKTLSPTHKISFNGRESPKRTEESKVEHKKPEPPVKSLTQLQYEKRSSEFINSLRDSSVPEPAPILPSFSRTFRKEPVEQPEKEVKEAAKPAAPEGKHLNLPLAVEHTLRKMSPITVSKKPVPVRPVCVVERASPFQPQPAPPFVVKSSQAEDDSLDFNRMAKMKVNMTTEEINRWLDDSTNVAIKHAKDCGIFENNQCECSFRTSGESMKNSGVGMSELVPKEETKVDHGVVEPPVQMKELDTVGKYNPETISTCKVEDYKEKLLSKTGNMMAPPKRRSSAVKSNHSMTEEEMCEYDFRFERSSNSPRESGSDVSSLTQRDDASTSSDHPERKIFQKRGPKRVSLSKSPCAFSAENESSIYAFEAEPPPKHHPFRRGRVKSEEEPASSSIAVQVNLETEPVLESSTQTENKEEHLFYLPLDQGGAGRRLVEVKVGREGPSQGGGGQKVVMSAKLVQPPRPEHKVRPLGVGGAPVGTVQPTLRATADQGTTTCQPAPVQSTSTATTSNPPPSDTLKGKSEPQLPGANFPLPGAPPATLEAPTFYPSEAQFQDPLEYIRAITPLAQSYGICRIVPPSSFKPECKVSDDMRFTAYNQHVHKMMHRWGPNVREMTAIRKHLAKENVSLKQIPWIGGMEVDLPRLYQTVQQCGGLGEVIEKKKWGRVADTMRIPKCAQDRLSKLDHVYCKYLLSYHTLAPEEREKLLEEVDREWEERQKRLAEEESSAAGEGSEDSAESEEGRDECVTKGKSMALSCFFRVARNTMSVYFRDTSPTVAEVETEFWRHVTARSSHVCVHYGSVDSGTWGYGFPTSKSSATARHPWNLKVLTNSPGSVLRCLGPLMGVTVPTLHLGMLFTACCWYRDPHGLPWIEYLHTGASKIWYGVPDSWASELRAALYPLLPRHTRDRPIWLPSDTAMVPPSFLLDRGVSLCRVVQEPGEFMVVFPKAFTSSICTGYVVSESVYFAQPSWLHSATQIFTDIEESCEPPVFSLERLLFNIANDVRSSPETLLQVLPMVEAVVEKEVRLRKEMEVAGVAGWERLPGYRAGRRKQAEDIEEVECEVCRGALFLSRVDISREDSHLCLSHGVQALAREPALRSSTKLYVAYLQEEMTDLIEKVKSRIESKMSKKNSAKSSTSSSGKNWRE